MQFVPRRTPTLRHHVRSCSTDTFLEINTLWIKLRIFAYSVCAASSTDTPSPHLKEKDNHASDALSHAPVDNSVPDDEVDEEVNLRVCVVSSLAMLPSADSDFLSDLSIDQISQAAKSGV